MNKCHVKVEGVVLLHYMPRTVSLINCLSPRRKHDSLLLFLATIDRSI
jgi:hypothetical protein